MQISGRVAAVNKNAVPVPEAAGGVQVTGVRGQPVPAVGRDHQTARAFIALRIVEFETRKIKTVGGLTDQQGVQTPGAHGPAQPVATGGIDCLHILYLLRPPSGGARPCYSVVPRMKSPVPRPPRAWARLTALASGFIHQNMSQPRSSLLTVLDLVPFGQTGQESRFFALRLTHPEWEQWRPGQFVMVRPTSFGLEIPWARPLGICHMTARHMICFFQVQGRGTRRMAELKAGDTVRVWGPLGNGFAVEPDTPTLLLAGGMGIVPFVGYVNEHPKPWNVTMLFGHREPLSCYPVDSINEHVPLDSLREHTPGDLDNFIFSLQERMREYAEQNGLVLACGPLPFLRTVQKFAGELGVRTQLSLENRMGCGVGACLGCVVRTTEAWPVPAKRGGLIQVCNQGPVFWSHHIEL